MSKKNCLIIELVLAIITAVVSFIYPLYTDLWKTINVLQLLPDTIPCLFCATYVVAVILLAVAVLQQSSGCKSALPWSASGVVLLLVFPGPLLLRTGRDLNMLSEWYRFRELAGIVTLVAIVLVVLEIVYYNLPDEAPSTVKSKVDKPDKAPKVTENDRKEYAPGLSLKSDEELKTIVRNEKMYDPILIALAREELTERVVGKRYRQTQEECCHAEKDRTKIDNKDVG